MCFFLETFSLLGSGNNQYGSLGSGNPNSSFSFISVDIAPSDIIQISSGFYFSAALFGSLFFFFLKIKFIFFLKANGTIKIWGDNGSGQLGQGITGSGQYIPLFVPGLSNVKEISCGGTHILALLGKIIFVFFFILNDFFRKWKCNGMGR